MCLANFVCTIFWAFLIYLSVDRDAVEASIDSSLKKGEGGVDK